jgi:tetratricopeptide (TPR) repeat protein
MLEYVKILMEKRDYESAIKLLEQMLHNYSDRSELLDISLALAECETDLQLSERAIVHAEVSKRLSEELSKWDSYGESCLYLGFAAHHIGRYTQAISHYVDYCRHRDKYTTATRFEVTVWYNLGVSYRAQGNLPVAVHMYRQALSAAHDSPIPGMEQSMRLTLIRALMDLKQFEQIPRLLAKCLAYLHRRQNDVGRDDSAKQESFINYSVVAIKYCVATHRQRRALLLAARTLRRSEGHALVQAQIHFELANMFLDEDDRGLALDHAVTAESFARECRTIDFETRCSRLVLSLIQ